jgi:hypothetical protein
MFNMPSGEREPFYSPNNLNEEEQDRVTFGYRMKLEQIGLTRRKFIEFRDRLMQGLALTPSEKAMLIDGVDVPTKSRLDSQINDVIRELRHWDPERVRDYEKKNLIRLCDILLSELML